MRRDFKEFSGRTYSEQLVFDVDGSFERKCEVVFSACFGICVADDGNFARKFFFYPFEDLW